VSDNQFNGLVAIVQYRRKRGHDDWHNMAAFDSRSMADTYCANCSKDDLLPWEYQVIDVQEQR
jgi:hypothetical protein